VNVDADDTDKSDSSTQKPDDFTRTTRKTPKRLPVAVAVAVKSQAAVTDTKTSDELTGVHARSPAEPKDIVETVPGDKKVVSTKPKVTRQRIMEVGKLAKSVVGRVKPLGSAGSVTKKMGSVTKKMGMVSKKMGMVDNKTEKKPPGRPASGSKIEEKFVKKKLLVEEKKSAASGQVDVKRTMNLLVEKVDSNKEDKSSAQKRVCVYCYVFCD